MTVMDAGTPAQHTNGSGAAPTGAPGTAGATSAQRDALQRLLDQAVLSPAQAESVRAELARAPAGGGGPARWLAEVAGYIGGGLMLAGAILALNRTWPLLDRTGRAALLAGFALAFIAAGLLVAGGPVRVWRLRDGGAGARRRIVGVLFALASVPAAFTAGVLADRAPGTSATATGLLVALAGLLMLPTAAAMVAVATMSSIGVLQVCGEVLHPTPQVVSLLFVVLGMVWVAVASLRLLPSRSLGLAVGAGLALIAARSLAVDPGWFRAGYGLALLLAAGCFLLYRWQRAVVLLVAGVIGATLAIPDAVTDWTGGAFGGSMALLAAGATLVLACALGLRLRHGVRQGSGGHAAGGPVATRGQ